MYVKKNRSLDETKELKVRIPIEQHLQLHSLKVLTGKAISATVSEALYTYFDDVFPNQKPPAVPFEAEAAEESAERAAE